MSVTLKSMPAARLSDWMRRAAAEDAADMVRLGEDADAAGRAAVKDLAGYFPDGAPLPGHLLFEVHADDGREVGYLWIGPTLKGHAGEWWVWDILIEESEQGKGYGRAALLAGEKLAAENGGVTMGLRVLGFNDRAKSLYDSLGYETTSHVMSKRLA